MEQNEKLGIVIQARTGSTRLKQKMIKPFYDQMSILEILVLRIKRKFPHQKIILATTSSSSDAQLCDLANRLEIECFTGSEHNVLDRFVQTAALNGLDAMVRICADNPFLSMSYLGELIGARNGNEHFDYLSFETADATPAIKTHFGFFAEIVSLSALLKVSKMTKDPLYLEHVTNYIYSHSKIFSLKWLEMPKNIKNRNDIRLTIDTLKDFHNAQYILKLSNKDIINIEIDDVMQVITHHDEILQSMKSEIALNSK